MSLSSVPYDERRNAKCLVVNVIMLSAVMPNVVMVDIVILNVEMLSTVILNVVMLSALCRISQF